MEKRRLSESNSLENEGTVSLFVSILVPRCLGSSQKVIPKFQVIKCLAKDTCPAHVGCCIQPEVSNSYRVLSSFLTGPLLTRTQRMKRRLARWAPYSGATAGNIEWGSVLPALWAQDHPLLMSLLHPKRGQHEGFLRIKYSQEGFSPGLWHREAICNHR
jgi:hypothetical protein